MKLGRGVSAQVKEAARKLVETEGPGALRKVAKVHFRTAHEIAPDSYAPRRPPPAGVAEVAAVGRAGQRWARFLLSTLYFSTRTCGNQAFNTEC